MHGGEDAVQGGDLAPVRARGARRLRVEGGDGRLQRVASGGAAALAQGRLYETDTLGDLLAIPAAPVLVLQQHDIPRVVETARAPRIVQEHEGEEPLRLRLVGQELHEHAAEPDGLIAQLVTHELLAEAR